jgi:tetratricopeptide (TPR) repeat protein
MKHLKKPFYLLAFIAVASLSGCSLAKMIKMAAQQKLTVVPSPLELHADSVAFEMSALLPVNMLRKGKVYSVAPSYKYSDQNIKLKEVAFRFEDFPNQKNQQPQVKERFSFPYKDEYKRGDLVVVGIASDQNGKSKSTPELPLTKGVITTSRMVRDVYKASYAEHGYNNQEELEPTYVNFFFEQGKSVLRKSEIKGNSGKFLDAFIAARNVTRTVVITGMHSPEGTESKNTKLASDRPAEIQKYYRAQMQKLKYGAAADSINFIIKPVVRDFAEFKKVLSADAKFTAEEKTEIMSIVDAAGSFEEKEMSLQKLKTYKRLMKDIYPQIRTAKTEILTVKRKKPDATIIALAQAIGQGTAADSALTDEELSFGAMNTPVLEDRAAIYKAATKKNDSWQSHNNLGASYLELAMKQTDKGERFRYADLAITHLQIAKNKQDIAIVNANLACAMMMKNEGFATSLGMLKKVLDSNPSATVRSNASAMKGVLEIKLAMYKEAIASFNNTEATADVKYNRSLAYLLDKQFNQAKGGFNEVVNENTGDAKAAYLLAVTAARLGNESDVFSNLRKAIAIDNSMKSVALDDLEFLTYFTSEGFKDALK